jgi:epoxyqueuosine reductase QueG
VIFTITISPIGAVLEDLKDHPTLLYLHHYRQANYRLDRIAFDMTALIQRAGGMAIPIAASQIVDWEGQRGHLSHKALAHAAGLGWWGRNNLLVNPAYGARVRLVSILTDLPMLIDSPLDSSCDQCRRCIVACPAGAIKEDSGSLIIAAVSRSSKSFVISTMSGNISAGYASRHASQKDKTRPKSA